jgi:RecA/RadA recombinase
MKKAETPLITKLSDKRAESFIESGIAALDAVLGGGFYRGRITEISGNEGVGKTHLVSLLMANMSDKHKILFCDAEFSLNKDRVEALGANPANIEYLEDSRLEDVAEAVINGVGKYDLIILDSLASLVPMTMEAQGVGESANIGLYSRLIKQFVMKLRPRLGKSETAFVVINQMRKSLSLYARKSDNLPGGMAWGHVCDVRLALSTNSNAKIMKDGVRTGHWVEAETFKNKVAAPHVKTKFKLEY